MTGGGRPPRIALCHEWLTDRFGSEKTFEAMAAALPNADLYALTVDDVARFSFGGRAVATTFLDGLRPLRDRRAMQLPLMPLAWRLATRAAYDVVVTSSHACAKGFRPGRAALHLCYCYTPMRYVWLNGVDRRAAGARPARIVAGRLRSWDLASVAWVDHFAAISAAVRDRVRGIYGRDACVIHPPVDTGYFTPGPDRRRRTHALVASRMVPYKRIDLAVRACHAAGQPLVVAGAGPEERRLRELAGALGAQTTFEISPSDGRLRDLYRSARVVVFPSEEDFGIVAVEAQACGTPVVALGRGGSADTVSDGVTGALVAGQEVDLLRTGVERVLALQPDADACRSWAEQFSPARFRERFTAWVSASCAASGIDIGDPVRA